MRASLHVDFTATQKQCRELNFVVSNKVRDVFGLALQGLDALQEFGEAKVQVAALEARSAD